MVTNGGFQTVGGSPTTIQNAGAPTDGVDEVQALDSTATGGSFAITFVNPLSGASQKTAAIAWNATKAAVEAALLLLSNMPALGVAATGAATVNAGQVVLTFGGVLSGMNVAQLVVDNALATGGTVVASTTTAGVAGTGRGAPKGALLIDNTTPKLWQNSNSETKPVWIKVGTQS
jgi:hypothetical protein